MSQPEKIGKREDKLPLERALRALEDVHQSLKEFSKQPSVAKNAAMEAAVKATRHKARKLRKRTAELSALWDHTFEGEL
jgi:hypothetical protein